MSWERPDYRAKLWYETGRHFVLPDDGKEWESPELGLLFVTQPGQDYDLIEGEDHYIYRTDLGKWTKHNLMGLLDQFTRYARFISAYRRGWWMFDRDRYETLRRQAVIETRGK